MMDAELKVLVVEDDAPLRDALCLTLRCAGIAATGVGDGPAALAAIGQDEFHLVVSDYRMQPMDGLALLEAIRGREPWLPVLLMTAFGEVDTAVAAMRGGACDFLLKPFEPATLIERVQRYALAPPAVEGMVAVDPRTRQALALAARVAATEATVLLTGESGTGKEVFARYIHQQSARAKGPFVAINCAAIPENLLEATLFGHERGAYTGAQSAQPGKFEQAQAGTLLLDEISEMPMALQAKLLRVLQEREVERVGGKAAVKLDIRVLATSNRDMAQEVARGAFREDLFYRLNVFPLRVPSLRERAQDIVPLARHFAERHGAQFGRAARLSVAAEANLAGVSWPGNVRELENAIQRALIMAPGDWIEPEHFGLPSALVPTAEVLRAPVVPDGRDDTPHRIKDLERQHILETLAAVGGSRKLAVERLGISERALRYKLQQYRSEGAL
jgi:two-component system response regulator FlrC